MSSENYKRVVVESTWEGNVIPGRLDELLRQVYVRAGAHVTGGVFGHDVHIEGPAEIGAAVYATNDLLIVCSGEVRCRSGIGARGILTNTAPGGRLLVWGDVVARSVRLENALVRGSVHGDEVRLNNCIILGVVNSGGTVELQQSSVLTASAGELTFGEKCALLLPYAEASRVTVTTGVRLAMLPDSDEHLLTAADIVSRNDRQCLTVGNRLANLLGAAGSIRNASNLIARLTITQEREVALNRFDVDPRAVAAPLRPLLAEIDKPIDVSSGGAR